MPTTPNPFSQCKLCGGQNAAPRYLLGNASIYRCPACDFHYLDQLDGATPEAVTPLTDQGRLYIEARLDEGAHLPPLRLELVQSFVDLPAAKALDIGAGLGQFILLLQQQGATAIGIEPSYPRRAYAEETWGLQLISRLVHDPYWQNTYASTFELITLWDVIEHVDYPRSTLEDAVKLLKPGGLLCLDTPDREVFSYRFSQWIHDLSGGKLSLFLPNFYSTIRYGHKQIFTRRQISTLLEAIGLELLTIPAAIKFPRDKLVICARKR